MERTAIDYKNNRYRFMSVAVDGYESRRLKGKINHDALQGSAEYNGWMDFMVIINQILGKIKAPKLTVDMRSFGSPIKKELQWKKWDNSLPKTSLVGRLATFRLFFRYRYHASWQGTVIWLENKETYQFDSFLDLLKIMDRILLGKEVSFEEPDALGGKCQIAADGSGEDLRGEVRRAAVNYRESFLSASELIDCVAGAVQKEHSVESQIVSGEMLSAYRKKGERATFTISVLYRQHSTWQGTVYCRELKEEKSFRSFMELLNLMASAIETVKLMNSKNDSSDLYGRGFALGTG